MQKGRKGVIRALTREEVESLIEGVKRKLRKLGPEIRKEAPGLSPKARSFTIDY